MSLSRWVQPLVLPALVALVAGAALAQEVDQEVDRDVEVGPGTAETFSFRADQLDRLWADVDCLDCSYFLDVYLLDEVNHLAYSQERDFTSLREEQWTREGAHLEYNLSEGVEEGVYHLVLDNRNNSREDDAVPLGPRAVHLHVEAGVEVRLTDEEKAAITNTLYLLCACTTFCCLTLLVLVGLLAYGNRIPFWPAF